MSIIDLFESSEHRNNMAHFAAIYNLAITNWEINHEEGILIIKFKEKLSITDSEYEEIISNSKKYPIIPQTNLDYRLERILDFFKIIFSDHAIDNEERRLIKSYAIQLGYSENISEELIKKSEKLFLGKFDIDEFRAILKVI